jgi:septal ring factor EnvC (AmiA/AmiB activator)
MTVLTLVLAFAAGLLFGGVALWLALKGRIDAARAQARGQAEVELAVANERARSFTAERDALQEALGRLKTELETARADRETLGAQHGLVSGQLTPLREQLATEAAAREQAERLCASLRADLSEMKASY